MSIEKINPKPKESPIIPTEEVLDTFSRLHEDSLGKEIPSAERAATLKSLHEIAGKFGNQEMLRAYEEGRVPTFASMEKAVDLINQELSSDDSDLETQRLLKFLSQRVKEIRLWCLKYEQIIIVFQRKKERLFFSSDSEVANEFQKTDKERRRIHDNLMDSIRSLDQTILKINDIEPLSKPIARWVPGKTIPENFAHEKPLIFAASTATDPYRDTIRDWAIVANLEQKMTAQEAYLKNIDKK